METRIPFPRKGLNDAWAFDSQPSETTRDGVNMRSVDPTNNRIRGAQRAGLSKHYESLGVVPGASPVLAFESIVYDNKTVTYDAIASEDLEAVWAEKTKPNKAVLNLKTDSSGNLYGVVGKTVEKRNPDGKLLWAYTIPVDNELFTLGPLAVGADLGVYVAVDGGAPGSSGAAVYRISQEAVANSFDTEPKVWWAYQTDRFVREITLSNGDLVILEQDDVAHRCYVTTLTAINLPIPTVASSFDVPWPGTCMAVKEDGSVITGHPYAEDRKKLPLTPGVTIGLEAWRLEDLDDYENRVWSWYRAQDIVDQGLAEDGEEVKFWPDRSGNGRNLYASQDGLGGPTVQVAASSFVEASVLFDGTQNLDSLAGGGKDSQRDACKTMVPNHGDGAFCTFIVCRPRSQETDGETDGQGNSAKWRRYLFEQTHHVTYSGAAAGTWDGGPNTGAFISGLILNSKEYATPKAGDAYCWGKGQGMGFTGSSLTGDEASGYIRAYTSSSGNRTGTLYAGMPNNQGATAQRGAWTKEGQWDDPTADAPGEGLSIFAFMHCGGLTERVEVEVEMVNIGAGSDYIAWSVDPDWLGYIEDSTPVEVFIGGVSQGSGVIGKASGGVAVLTSTVADGTYTAQLVLERNAMSRSAMWVNGVPADRWEALPMAYTGMDSTAQRDYALDKNVAANATGLGYPDTNNGYVKGFFGEIVEIVTIGRRKTNADMVTLTSGTLGTEETHEWPAVLTHPMYASNQDAGASSGAGETDTSWATGRPHNNLDSSEFEKIYGWLAHRHGIQERLPDTTASYPHPHYPYTIGSTLAYDIPINDVFADSGQAWVVRKREDEAMIVKHDATGKMLWCLLASIQSGPGDLFSEDMLGNASTATARATNCVALGPDDTIYIAGPGDGVRGEQSCMGVIYDDVEDDRTPGLTSVSFYEPSVAEVNKMSFPADTIIRGQVDEFGNLHIPIIPGTTYSGAAVEDALRTFSQDGDNLFTLTTLGGSGYQNAHAVALPPSNPDFFTD